MARISKIWNLSPLRTRAPETPWTCCKTILNFMTGLTGPRIRGRQPRVDKQLMVGRHWLLTGVFLGPASVAHPQRPPPAPAPPPSAPPAPAPAPPATPPSTPQS